ELDQELRANRRLIATERKRQVIKAGFAYASGRMDQINWWDVKDAFVNHAYWIRQCNEFETEWHLRVSMAMGSLLFVVLGAPVGGAGDGKGRTIVLILDKQRYWAFLKAYVICYVSLVGLYIVIDAFSNLDEFSKRAEGAVEMFQIMSRYYLIHQSEFFDKLCGVIGMMAAVFTVTWMQRNNEQLAMLSAGISTHRAILPVL